MNPRSYPSHSEMLEQTGDVFSQIRKYLEMQTERAQRQDEVNERQTTTIHNQASAIDRQTKTIDQQKEIIDKLKAQVEQQTQTMNEQAEIIKSLVQKIHQKKDQEKKLEKFLEEKAIKKDTPRFVHQIPNFERNYREMHRLIRNGTMPPLRDELSFNLIKVNIPRFVY